MVTENGIWGTFHYGSRLELASKLERLTAQARSQARPDHSGGWILRVWFLDEQHGFAVGYQKAVLETHDGGRTWKPVAEAAKPTGNPAFTAYSRITFDGDLGIIVGSAVPPRAGLGPFPSWMDPDRATKTRPVPNVTLLLETRDQGVTWRSSTSSLFGIVEAPSRLKAPVGINVFGFAAFSKFRFGSSTAWT